MIQIYTARLTQAHLDEAFPHMGACRYTSPCIIGTLMTPEERTKVSDVASICHLTKVEVDDLAYAIRLQDAFDNGEAAPFLQIVRERLPEARFTFTREMFLAWVRKQDPNEEYNYLSNKDCPVARYLKHQGFRDANVGGWDWKENPADQRNPIPEGINEALTRARPRTYGFLAAELKS